MNPHTLPVDPADVPETDVAVIGLAGRFPKARTLAEFWSNLVDGVECIARFSERELLDAGVPAALARHPQYVPARGMLEGVDLFDAEFFGLKTAEARVLDPQQRLFLECAWEAMEAAGYDVQSCASAVGVYAGVNLSTYLHNIRANPEFAGLVGGLQVVLGNDKDYVATRASYKLNLRGPAVTVQTACSTSLVATHLAVQAVLAGECDMAIAGGATVTVPQRSGYLYQEDGIRSPDGHNRSFDAESGGTVPGSGVGVVVLKRLSAALRDGDPVHAVIKGSAINNDGSAKVSYMAPSVEGQARCVAEALALAGVHPDDIGMVEAHGTATGLGDPVEVAGLTRAFRSSGGTGVASTALGSIKSNTGHLDSAAGVAGLIKAVMAVREGIIPPSLHFTAPNPRLDLPSSPFFVPQAATAWGGDGKPRRAGVSSLGIGGTNAHVVLEQAPARAPSGPSREWQLLTLSAKTADALEAATANLSAHLAAHPEQPFGDVAHTLRAGRAAFSHRRMVVARDADEARALLAPADPRTLATHVAGEEEPSVAFLFPGGGAQFAGMAEDLYRGEPAFRAVVDDCAEILRPRLGFDLREVLFPKDEDRASAAERIGRARVAHGALFTIEYATARLLMSWGITPSALIGHSLGEYAAACVAGVFTLDDALELVTTRGELMETVAEGVMMVVPMAEADLAPRLGQGVSLASVNAPALCVVSGTEDGVGALEAAMAAEGVDCRRLHFSHASHSAMMDPIVEPFRAAVARANPRAPKIPFISSSTGTWITDEQATDPGYWAMHIRRTVRFSDGIAHVLREPGWVLVEAGPGATLARLARRQGVPMAGRTVVAALRAADDATSDARVIMEAVGRCWMAGVAVDWRALVAGERRQRVLLPTYPFQRRSYWVDAVRPAASDLSAAATAPAPLSATFAPEAAAEPTIVMEIPMQDTQAAAPRADRRAELRISLTDVAARLFGFAPEQVDPDTSFLEMGADSLLLMQASRAFENRTGVPVSFRTLMGELATINDLVAHVDAALPPEPVAAPVAAAPVVAAPVMAQPAAAQAHPAAPVAGVVALPSPAALSFAPGADASAVERVVVQQLALMARQLEMMGGAAPSPVSIPTISSPANGNGSANGHAAPRINGASTNGASSNGASSNGASSNGAAKAPIAPVNRVAAETAQQADFGPFRPVQTMAADPFTPRQRASIDAFMAEYIARTAGSKRFAADYRPYLSDPRATAGFKLPLKEIVYPIVSARTAGARMWDVDGNEYIDFTMGFGVHMFGHSPEFVTTALQAQLEKGFELGPQTYLAGRVARLVSEMTGHERVYFCNSGTEAVMSAVRMARAATGRPRIAIFEGSYHGTFDGVLARGKTVDGRSESQPATLGVAPGVSIDAIVLRYNDPASLVELRERAHEIACILVEPVQSRNLDLQPVEFLRELRRVTEETGVALIFDEIINGFRLHPAGAQGYFGIQADLASYGKVVGGGMPIGLVAGKKAYLDRVDGGAWHYGDGSVPRVSQTMAAGTFSKNPLAMAACEAVLEHLKAGGPEVQATLNARTARLAQALNELFTEAGVPLKVPTFGSLFRFVRSASDDSRWADLLFYHMIRRGIYVWEGRGCFLSTAHTDADLNAFIEAVRYGITEMRKGGFLPDGPAVKVDFPFPVVGAGDPVPFVDGPGGVRRLAPIAPQRQLWVHTQFGEGASLAYNELYALRLKGSLDVGALRRAVLDLAARHEALRTTFSACGSWLEIHPAIDCTVDVIDRAADYAAEGESIVPAITADEKDHAFDLVNGPLFRVRLHRLEDGHHLMALVFHHLIVDGHSVAVLTRDLRELFAARVEGREYTAPAGMQLSEYVAGRATAAGEAELADAEAYWAEHLRGARPLALPADRPAAPGDYRGAREALTLPAELAATLKGTARACGATLFNVLSAAWMATLHRLAGQNDVTIAVASLGREFNGDEKMLGHAVDLLPLRSTPAGDPAFREMVAAAKAELLAAYRHQSFAYARIVEAGLAVVGGQRLVSTTFNLDAAPAGAQKPAATGTPSWGGLQARRVAAPVRYVKFDLQLNVTETAGGLVVDLDYATARLDACTARRWLAAYARVLGAVGADAATPLSALPLMSGDDEARVLGAFNTTDAPVAEGCFHHLFAERAERAPGALAVCAGDESVTYGELNARANRLAHHLAAAGVRPEAPVGLCMERGADLVVGALAILKAGGCFVPLDPAYPRARLEHMLADSGAAHVVTRTALQAVLPDTGARAVCVDAEARDIAARPADDPAARVHADNLAYVIYTSGSTGRSKGVGVPHRGLMNLASAQARVLGLRDDDRVLQFASLSFDAATFEIVIALSSGAALVTASREALMPGQGLADLLDERGVTLALLPPSALAQLPEAGLPALRVVAVAGEACPPALAARWSAGRRFLNLYGPTEDTIWSTLHEHEGGPVTIGRPVPNTRAYVLDAGLRPLPVGIPGELCVGGLGVTRGYLRRPALTAERFVPDPFSGTPGARLYRTGDRARWTDAGDLEFLGRMDFQVKVRGFRVEPGEVEAVLTAHPAVRDAVVTAREDVPGDARLVAYVVGHEQAPAAGALREWCGERLPAWMVPSTFVALDALPLSPNGKTDRAALPAPDAAAQAGAYVAPDGPVEEAMAEIWAEVLRVERVGAADDFFALGGHSLLATRIAARVWEMFDVRVTLDEMFLNPTVAALAAVVEAAVLRQMDDETLPEPATSPALAGA